MTWGYICVCVLKMCLGKYHGTQTLFFSPLFKKLKKKGKPYFLKQAVTWIWHENMWGFSWAHAKSQQCNAHKRLYHFVVELFTTIILGALPLNLCIKHKSTCGLWVRKHKVFFLALLLWHFRLSLTNEVGTTLWLTLNLVGLAGFCYYWRF